ncbi:MAG: hypothetical protein J0L84_13205 [Verrucomicrobia bacterium]|nr:hypothetical protein [Verrucomicrobiota bacterium]
MPYRERFKELLAEAHAAGLTIDDERTSYLTTEHVFVTAFRGDARTFIVSDRGVWVTPVEAHAVVDLLFKGETIPHLQESHARGSPFP